MVEKRTPRIVPDLPEDTGLTAIQHYLAKRARHYEHLFCRVCHVAAPKHAHGLCDDCDRELGGGG